MKTEPETNWSPMPSEQGFTRVELTVVIGAVACLGALVLPALAKGNAGSHTAICLNNHRQLARSCLLYSQDVNGRLPNNYTLPATETAISTGVFDNWINNIMTWGASSSPDDVSNTNVNWAQKGPLSPYLNSNIGVFKCPSDIYLGAAQRQRRWNARLRSVSMNGFFGLTDTNPSSLSGRSWAEGGKYRQFLKTTDVPVPAMTWLTIDEHADSVNDGFFIVSATATSWGDLPASYHEGACGFSFADGHSEMHKWLSATSRYPVKYSFSTSRGFDAAGRKDFQWYKDRIQLVLFR